MYSRCTGHHDRSFNISANYYDPHYHSLGSVSHWGCNPHSSSQPQPQPNPTHIKLGLKTDRHSCSTTPRSLVDNQHDIHMHYQSASRSRKLFRYGWARMSVHEPYSTPFSLSIMKIAKELVLPIESGSSYPSNSQDLVSVASGKISETGLVRPSFSSPLTLPSGMLLSCTTNFSFLIFSYLDVLALG